MRYPARPGRRPSRPRLPPAWSRYSPEVGIEPADIRIMIWAGLILGLLIYQAVGWLPVAVPIEPPPVAAPPPPADPWQESERSRRILEAQERAPSPVGTSARGQTIDPAAIRVIDGDTFDYDGVRVRMVGLDTPETHPSRCPREADLGARATQRLSDLLAAGPVELVPIDRDEDRYGRKLRIVVRGGRNLAETLIAEGLARPYDGGRRSGWCA